MLPTTPKSIAFTSPDSTHTDCAALLSPLTSLTPSTVNSGQKVSRMKKTNPGSSQKRSFKEDIAQDNYDAEIRELERKMKDLKKKRNQLKLPDKIEVDNYHEEEGDEKVTERSLKNRVRDWGGHRIKGSRSRKLNLHSMDRQLEPGPVHEEYEHDVEQHGQTNEEPDRVKEFVTMLSDAFDYVDNAIRPTLQPFIHDITREIAECKKAFSREESMVSEPPEEFDYEMESTSEEDVMTGSKASKKCKASKNKNSNSMEKNDMVHDRASKLIESATAPSMELDQFKFVHVTVTALALSGLTVESNKKRKKNDSVPINAVLSVAKNTTYSDCSIYTHLPSLPVLPDPIKGSTKKRQGKMLKEYLLAVWPAENTANDECVDGETIEMVEDCCPQISPQNKQMGPLISSVAFSRLIGISKFSQFSNGVFVDSKKTECRYMPSMVELRVCITRGKFEILPIGVARLVVSGEERDAGKIFAVHVKVDLKFFVHQKGWQ